jgi:hypothetical protein
MHTFSLGTIARTPHQNPTPMPISGGVHRTMPESRLMRRGVCTDGRGLTPWRRRAERWRRHTSELTALAVGEGREGRGRHPRRRGAEQTGPWLRRLRRRRAGGRPRDQLQERRGAPCVTESCADLLRNATQLITGTQGGKKLARTSLEGRFSTYATS